MAPTPPRAPPPGMGVASWKRRTPLHRMTLTCGKLASLMRGDAHRRRTRHQRAPRSEPKGTEASFP
eukprot:1333664-Pyramimonas_sp.AAC.1